MALTFRVKSIEEKPGSGLCNAEIPGFFGVAVFILCLIKEKAGICLRAPRKIEKLKELV
jgi:hypothetical protein